MTYKLKNCVEHSVHLCSHVYGEPMYIIRADIFPIQFISSFDTSGLIHCEGQGSVLGPQRDMRKPQGLRILYSLLL